MLSGSTAGRRPRSVELLGRAGGCGAFTRLATARVSSSGTFRLTAAAHDDRRHRDVPRAHRRRGAAGAREATAPRAIGCDRTSRVRASVIREFNRPWTLEELPDPVAGPGQVVIRVHASGVCGTDVHVHHGYLDVSAPLVAGHEPVGEVVQVGAGVTSPGLGDRVGVSWIQRGCDARSHCAAGPADVLRRRPDVDGPRRRQRRAHARVGVRVHDRSPPD